MLIKLDETIRPLGFFVGVHWQRGLLCSSTIPMTKEEFMEIKGITEPDDVIGFVNLDMMKHLRSRAQTFFRTWAEDRRNKGKNNPIGVVTLKDLLDQGQL